MSVGFEMTESKNTIRYALFFAVTVIIQLQLMGIGSEGMFKSRLYEARANKEMSDEVLYKVVENLSQMNSASFYASLSLLFLSIIFVCNEKRYSRIQSGMLIGTNGFLIILKMLLIRIA